jgi:hypothetical protein
MSPRSMPQHAACLGDRIRLGRARSVADRRANPLRPPVAIVSDARALSLRAPERGRLGSPRRALRNPS